MHNGCVGRRGVGWTLLRGGGAQLPDPTPFHTLSACSCWSSSRKHCRNQKYCVYRRPAALEDHRGLQHASRMASTTDGMWRRSRGMYLSSTSASWLSAASFCRTGPVGDRGGADGGFGVYS